MIPFVSVARPALGAGPLAGLAAAALVALLAGCGPAASTGPSVPVELSRDTSCALDGMLLADFPGPKAQIHYAGADKPDFFCDTVEMFSLYLKPEQQKRVRALYVQDMAQTDWDAPQGHWIDAKAAFYIKDSKKRGSMGATLASFAQEADAQAFAAKNGGTVLRFDQVTPEMVVLDGGALHDKRM